MPTNEASGASCAISLVPTKTDDEPETTATEATACKEYCHESSLDPITHVFKEVVTIESTNSAQFKIHLDIKPTACCVLEKTATNQCRRTKARKSLQPHDYLVQFIFDGIKTSTAKLLRTQTGRQTFSRVNSVDRAVSRPFQFAPIKLVDPDDPAEEICQNEEIIKSLGTIEIQIFKCKLVSDKSPAPLAGSSLAKSTNQMSFSESNKKARLACTAGLGEPTINERTDCPTYIVKHKAVFPFLHFVFRYKPRSILIAEKIIPNPVVPTEPPATASSTASTSKPKPPPKSITIDSDSEPENNYAETSKSKKTNTDTISVKDEDSQENGSVCQCNCKNRRPAEGAGQVGESSDQKRPRLSDPDQKPKANPHTSHPSKPIFIDLTL
ncbi:hypothetical protein PTTG_05005 [Puccinia triticina 1-1 BBBD Race 1]|uniref:DUF7918 domain-containing protein n=2 Tax=Puccinia triticina TaxID=208348 RepID=A0A180GJC0_PUCT1|nr:uncharacterized protein PtA15_2A861 [Puccinia triticina]OAV92624.1 hypothetical protein PTTG_05005 [Puccinia triticina 1-1 BBBD Race 1]WAQ82544.1 hypothetical protein PtA15_2A861 [Puccinia triticina]